MTYKTIFVDWDGTLSNSRFWDGWQETDDYTRIQHLLFSDSTGKELANKWMTGITDSQEIARYLSDKTAIPYDKILHELQRSAENMTFIDSGDIDKIQRLRASGVTAILATDNMDTFGRWTIKSLQLEKYFDGFLVSYTEQALKTQFNDDGSSAFFQKYLNLNDLHDHESVLIDNSLETKIVEQFGLDFMHVTKQEPLSFHLSKLLDTKQ